MKKNWLIFILVLLFALPTVAIGETVVTSFYPIYLFTLSLTDGIDGLDVHNLAAPDTGCLHDYQLTTGDMKALAEADAFLVNGGGMESYMNYVFEAFPNLPVTDASTGIELLPDESGETEFNAHIWLDVSYGKLMVENLAAGLIDAFPEYAEEISANCEAYSLRLTALDEELKVALADVKQKDIVTFHEAFPYFAQAYGLNVIATITTEADEAISAYELTELVRTVRANNNPPLFTEPQYDSLAATTVATETGAKVYELDPCVTGPEVPSLNYYEDVMRQNLNVLLEALND